MPICINPKISLDIYGIFFLVDYHCDGRGGWSEIFSFKALKAGSDWSPSIALYGDLGNVNPKSISTLQEEAQRGDYDALLHIGNN